MAGVSEGPNAFFRLSPAEGHAGNGPVWYAIQRGQFHKRLDAYSNQPHFRALFARIHGAGMPASTFAELATSIFSGTTPLAKGDAYVEPPAGVRFLRSGEITEDGDIVKTSEVHISQAAHIGLLKRSQLQSGDLLIAIVGATIGAVGIYSDQAQANINQAIAVVRLRPGAIRQEFALWYLHSSLGQRLLDYFKRPVARANINLEEVGDIPLIVPTDAQQEALVAAMEVERARRRAKQGEASALLAGLDDYLVATLGLTPSPKHEQKVFAVTRGVAPTRFDPHFHLPAFAQNQQMLAANGGEPLGSIATFSKEVWKPEKHDAPTFRYIEISGVDRDTGEAQAFETQVVEAPSRARMAVHTGDIIVSLTRPHHGSIAQITPALDSCVASTGFAVIRNVDQSRVMNDYLWCILRSKMCLMQMLQRASGGNYPAITEPELAKVLIPIPTIDIQSTIAAEARRRRDESRRLRAEADSGWQAAKLWFEEQLLGSVHK